MSNQFSADQNIKIQGLPALYKSLEEISAKLANKFLKKAVTAASKIAVKAAKKNLGKHKETGSLRRSIGARVSFFKRGVKSVGKKSDQRHTFYAAIGPRRKHHTYNPKKDIMYMPTKYAHLVERGVRPHFVGAGSMSQETVLARMNETKAGKAPSKKILEKMKARMDSVKSFGRLHPGFPGVRFLHRAVNENREKMFSKMIDVLKDLTK